MEAYGGEITAYLRGTRHLPEVSDEEEVELAKWIEAGLYAEQLLGQTALKRSHEEKEELAAIAQRGKEAKDTLVADNLQLLVNIAKRYQFLDPTLTTVDLAQEGCFGLIHAIEKFDYKKGVPLAPYAAFWIRKTIVLGLAAENRGGKVTRDRYERYMQFNRILRQNNYLSGDALNLDEVISELGERWTMPMAEDSLQLHEAIYRGSYDVEISSEEGSLATVGELFGSSYQPSVEDVAIANSLSADNYEQMALIMAQLQAHLSPELYEVFTARAGLEGPSLSTDELARYKGVPNSTISRRLLRAKREAALLFDENEQFAQEVETLAMLIEYGNL